MIIKRLIAHHYSLVASRRQNTNTVFEFFPKKNPYLLTLVWKTGFGSIFSYIYDSTEPTVSKNNRIHPWVNLQQRCHFHKNQFKTATCIVCSHAWFTFSSRFSRNCKRDEVRTNVDIYTLGRELRDRYNSRKSRDSWELGNSQEKSKILLLMWEITYIACILFFFPCRRLYPDLIQL